MSGQALSLQMLRPPKALVTPDFKVPLAPKEATKMAVTLLKQMQSKKVSLDSLAPSQDELKKVIQAKIAGTELKPAVVAEPDTTIDLMEALKASIASSPRLSRTGKVAA